MKANNKKHKKYGIIPTLVVLLIFVISGIYGEITKKDFAPREEKLNIYCLDVGQGDCTYMVFPDGKTMLIDAGEADSDAYIKLRDYITEGINYFVITHPHSDHAGGAEDVIDNYEIETILMPDAGNTSSFFENLLDKIAQEEIPVIQAKTGTVIHEREDFKAEIISPREEGYNDLNNMSAVVKITYGENEFLFMGDAEKEVEEDITADVRSDFIRVGHHGSNTSSSKSFLNRVKPKYAVISVGEFNSYGHPHREVLNRYEKIGTQIYRTDQMGNIFVTSDGKTIEFVTENRID